MDQLEQLYRQAYERDPLFAPHAEICFETEAVIGEGGMGTVMRVRDHRLGREAALKILKKDRLTPKAAARFQREALITARLSHPSIPPVYEAGRTPKGALYLLMKLIEGRSMAELIASAHRKKRPGPAIKELLGALVKVGEALAYAHSRGIIHRDLKPENLMVGRFGEVMVMDWGIARDLRAAEPESEVSDEQPLSWNPDSDSRGLTRAGGIVGTIGFMAPEQARGGVVDERADIFSLGVLLTLILTNKQAVPGSSPREMFAATLKNNVRGPRQIDSRVPRELDAIARAALAPEIENRTAGAEDFVAALQAALAGEPVPGYRYSSRERLQRWLRRHPFLPFALSILALVTIPLGLMWQRAQRSDQARREAQVAAETTRRVLELLTRARSRARRGAPFEQIQKPIEDALDAAERSYPALLEGAQIYERGRQREAARALLEEARDRFDPAYEALFQLYEIESRGEAEELVETESLRELRRRALARGDENEFTLFARGLAFYERGDHSKALAAFEAIEKHSLGFVRGHSLRAVSLFKLGRAKEARAAHDRALALAPDDPRANTNRGQQSFTEGRYDEAIADFNRALAADPLHALAYLNRGGVYLATGQRERALDDFNKAIEIRPDLARAYNNRALVLMTRDPEAALADLNKAISLEPGFSKAYNNRGNLQRMRGFKAEALDDHNTALELEPDDIQSLVNRSNVYQDLGQLERALADLNRVIELAPDFAKAYNNRGALHRKRKDLERARADFKRALFLDPTSANPHINLANLATSEGAYQKALAHLDRAIAAEPKNVLARLKRGLLLLRFNRKDEALADWRAALEAQPAHPKAAEIRALLAQYDKAPKND